MAKQAGIHLLTGTIGNASFYKDPEYGYLVRQKSSLNKDKIYRSPESNTLKNASEFKRATSAAALMRKALDPTLERIKNSRLSGRMNALLLKFIQSDSINLKGQRCPQNGQPALLQGFNFNTKYKLRQVFPVDYTCHIDVSSGRMLIDIPSFIPLQMLETPGGASHFRIVSVGASLDFTEKKAGYVHESDLMAIGSQTVPAFTLEHTVATEAGQFLLLTLGILFYTLPENIPAGLLSKRRRSRLGNGDALVAYTGALEIVRAATTMETAAAT